ncbi:MAG: hypothetical protein OQK99_04440 [Gammaproteobacteria bacterium]|nr:hypothetical protein [Gammaproteobacteria bacterium]
MYIKAEEVQKPLFNFTISARGKNAELPVFAFLRRRYGNIPLNQIESMFGFVERSTLYGGRPFTGSELSDNDVTDLNRAGIGLRLPLTNHEVSREEYEGARALLTRYHHKLNSVIATNDDLATWIAEDFPLYKRDASVIKNINNPRKLARAMEIYDSVVLPMPCNEDFEFLESIEYKDRITLFANAGCAMTCPSRICYASFSEFNKFKGADILCSQTIKERESFGMIDFQLEPLLALGFTHFKLLRSRPGAQTGF